MYILETNKTIFHGTSWFLKPGGHHTALEVGDFDVAWVTLEENIANEFAIHQIQLGWSKEKGNIIAKDRVAVVMRGKLIKDVIIFEIGLDKFVNPDTKMEYDYDEFREALEIDDIRECYKYIKRMGGYDGVAMEGSVGFEKYEDIALFYPDKDVEFAHFKFYSPKKKRFTKFMSKKESLDFFTDLIKRYKK